MKPSTNQSGQSTSELIDQLHPRVAFWTGALFSGGTIFAIGLVVLAVLMMQQVDFKKTAQSNNTNVDATALAEIPADTITLDSMRNKRGTGELTIVEYADTECPFCKRFHSTMQQIVKEYDGRVAWAYKQLPLTGLHSKAKKEAVATECAANQDKFWEYLDAVFETTNSNNSLPDEELYSIADRIGLDRTTFDLCVSNQDTQDRIAFDTAEAQRLGVTGTPYSYLVDADGTIIDVIPGALDYDDIVVLLDSHL